MEPDDTRAPVGPEEGPGERTGGGGLWGRRFGLPHMALLGLVLTAALGVGAWAFLGDGPYRSSVRSDATYDVIFLGDSLVAQARWGEGFGNCALANYGVSGATVTDTGDLATLAVADGARAYVVLAGINDLAMGREVTDIARDYDRLLGFLRRTGAEIYAIELLPTDRERLNAQARALNEALMPIAHRHGAHVLSAHDRFIGQDGLIDPMLTNDGVHLTPGGNRNLWDAVSAAVDAFCAPPAAPRRSGTH